MKFTTWFTGPAYYLPNGRRRVVIAIIVKPPEFKPLIHFVHTPALNLRLKGSMLL
ncbi:MAG: hypothetical protein GH158_05435 [Dehalococcoidia bacterium]|nr:hypothetical protein [Dehalococcoidia bacterium]